MKWMKRAILIGFLIIVSICWWIKERGEERVYGECARVYGQGWVTIYPADTTQGAICTDQSGRAFKRTAPLYTGR